MNDFFNAHRLTKYINVNPKTIYRRLSAEGIPAYKAGRTWRIGKK